ncbi:MAG: universal stress protein [Gammaproteobacteria bacterium]
MFHKALIGIDPSPAEQSLLSCLPDLKRWGIEQLVLSHVVTAGYVQAGGFGHEDDYRAWLEERAEELRGAGFGVETTLTTQADTAAALLELSAAHAADVVVVGSRSHNFLHYLFLGSVARRVVQGATLPVLIEWLEPTVEGDAETCTAICGRALEQVLLATDLSPHSQAAEGAALALAPAAGRVDCLSVVAAAADPAARDAIARQLEERVKNIITAGGKGQAIVESGDAASAIALKSREGYSLIIVGKHGQNWIAGAVIGSTAAYVCEHAGRPVLMVPMPGE